MATKRMETCRKGQAPKSYLEGKLQAHSFANRSKEEMKEIRRHAEEAKRKKKEESQMLRRCMRDILSLRITSKHQRDALKEMGFNSEDLTNQTLLMTALFRKGLTGDVSAIKEIIQMMDRLEMFNDTEEAKTKGITINVIQQGTDFHPTPEIEQQILEVENGQFTDIDILDDTDPDAEIWDEDDWGNEVYTP